MSSARVSRTRLPLHADTLGCDLHAAMLPLLAVVATYADEPYRRRARAHLERIWKIYGFNNMDLGNMIGALWKQSGTMLEPFHCPIDLCRSISMACGILARDSKSDRGDLGRILLMSHGLKIGGMTGAWSGVELDGQFAIPFQCRDFRRREAAKPTTAPTVSLGIDLDQLSAASIVPTTASIEVGSSEPSLTIELPAAPSGICVSVARPSLHFGHGFTVPASGSSASETGPERGRPMRCAWIKPGQTSEAPVLVPIAGEVHRNPRPSTGHTVTLPLPPTLMLRLAALPGAKRFVVRVPCEAAANGDVWITLSRTIVGTLDASGVRAALLPWEGWTPPSPEWMPFAPFAPAPTPDELRTGFLCGDGDDPILDDPLRHPAPGTFDALVDLLLELSTPTAPPEPESAAAQPSRRRLRPVSHLGTALLRLKKELERQRTARAKELKLA